jgi:tyrosine-protein phosphatase YwqE
MFGLFKTTLQALPDFSALGTDLHSHLLPGIDDGSPNLETSLNLIQGLQALGYQRIFTTPHVMEDFYPNTRSLILRKRDEVLEALQDLGIEVEFNAAAEYSLDANFVGMIKNEPLLTLPGDRVLIEMSFYQAHRDLHQIVFDLQMKGYRPILAHPERYPYYHKPEDYETLKSIGCALQVNLLSLTGYYGKPVQTAAKTILSLGFADFLATDLHHERHIENLRQALSNEWVVRTLQTNTFQNASL